MELMSFAASSPTIATALPAAMVISPLFAGTTAATGALTRARTPAIAAQLHAAHLAQRTSAVAARAQSMPALRLGVGETAWTALEAELEGEWASAEIPRSGGVATPLLGAAVRVVVVEREREPSWIECDEFVEHAETALLHMTGPYIEPMRERNELNFNR